jgi:hypothetical protein
MPVDLESIHTELLPGLMDFHTSDALAWSVVFTKETAAARILNEAPVVAMPLPVAVAMGAVAVVVKNPMVTRRLWQFWKSKA